MCNWFFSQFLALPDMVHFIIVYLVVVVGIAMACLATFGSRVGNVSDLGPAILNLLMFGLLGDDAVGIRILKVSSECDGGPHGLRTQADNPSLNPRPIRRSLFFSF